MRTNIEKSGEGAWQGEQQKVTAKYKKNIAKHKPKEYQASRIIIT